MTGALVIACSYLLGSVPFGIVFARAKGVDLRRVGSGNIGATNVLRAAGKGPAVLT
ncbi:MAG: glycerol-3-phosphate acyltransferase, partial [Nitrospirota bacterium]